MAKSSTRPVLVLVHGAWHGSWCWKHVVPRLEKQGFTVLAPTLTGLAERRHLLTPTVSLGTHIEDVVQAMAYADVERYVLVGHSFGGMVVTGAADQRPDGLCGIVYLDAAVPQSGESMISQGAGSAAELEQRRSGIMAQAADGLALPVLPPAVFGIPAGHPDHDWVLSKLTPHPIKTWLDPIELTRGPAAVARCYVHCTDPVLPGTSFPRLALMAQQTQGWRYREIKTGHDAMITAPRETAAILAEEARMMFAATA